jgi:hypothetical protein
MLEFLEVLHSTNSIKGQKETPLVSTFEFQLWLYHI